MTVLHNRPSNHHTMSCDNPAASGNGKEAVMHRNNVF